MVKSKHQKTLRGIEIFFFNKMILDFFFVPTRSTHIDLITLFPLHEDVRTRIASEG